ncbi:hypothetical protein [Bacillus sp. FSL R5-0439]|uniref:hypothetical protein n=1 Tax=Bacillus sp. FSL R5-0439 TaxID=2954586 RepID=UPI00403FCC76
MYEGEGEYFTGLIRYPNFVHEIFKVGGQTSLFKYVKLIAAELVSLSLIGKETFEVSDLYFEKDIWLLAL